MDDKTTTNTPALIAWHVTEGSLQDSEI